MKQLAYLLLLLMISAQVDDVWAVAPVSPSAPLAEDEDYLPSPRRLQEEEESSARQKQVFFGFKPQTADFPLVRRGLPFECDLTAPFTPAPLYVFMSLLI
jgi:hypothetical protein